MRQLKQALKTKKNEIHGCGTSQCVTLNCRRLNDEFCGCGDGGGGGGDIPITNLYNLPMGQEIFTGDAVRLFFNYEPDNATNVSEQINIYPLNMGGEIDVSSGMGGQPGEYWIDVRGVSPGEAEVECDLNGTPYFGTPITVVEPVAVESCNFPANMVVYTGGGAGVNQDVGQISYSPTNATHPENYISFAYYDGEYVGDFYLRDCENGDGIIWFNGVSDDYVGRTVTYKGMVNGEYVSDIDVEVKKGVSVIDFELFDVELGVGETNQNNWFAVTDYTGDIESLAITQDDNIANVLLNEEIVDGHIILRVCVVGRAEGNTRLQIEDTRGHLYGFNINVTSGGDIPITSMSGIADSIEVMENSSHSCILYYEPTNATNPDGQIEVSIQDGDGVAQINAAYVTNPGEYYLEIAGMSAGSATCTISLNGEEYSIIPITIKPSIHIESISNFPNYVEVYTGGSAGLNQDAIEFDYLPVDANYVPSDVGLSPLNDSIGDFWVAGFGGGHANFAYSPTVGDEAIGNEYSYNVLLNGDTIGTTTFHINKGVHIFDGSNTELYINVGETNTDNWVRLDDYGYGIGSLRLSYDSYILNVRLAEGLDERGNDIIWVKVEGVTSGSSMIYITDVSGYAVYFNVNVS